MKVLALNRLPLDSLKRDCIATARCKVYDLLLVITNSTLGDTAHVKVCQAMLVIFTALYHFLQWNKVKDLYSMLQTADWKIRVASILSLTL